MQWQEVESSNVSAVAYHAPTQRILVRFKNGRVYSYRGAPPEVYEDLRSAESVGKFLNAKVKREYPYAQESADIVETLNAEA